MRACHAVKATSGNEPASSKVIVAGFRARSASGTAIRSANAPMLSWRPPIDLIARLEGFHHRADPEYDAGNVVAKDQRKCVGKYLLELAGPDLLVQLIASCGST